MMLKQNIIITMVEAALFVIVYQFEKAITQYNLYTSKKTKKTEAFEVKQLIINCENGKTLSQIGKITNVVQLQTDINGFYDAFKFNKGRILPTRKYNSKIDKKKKYISNVYYPDEYSVANFIQVLEIKTMEILIYIK